jgi:hypothetical protein
MTIGRSTISGNSIEPMPAAGLWIQRSKRATSSCSRVTCAENATSASWINVNA